MAGSLEYREASHSSFNMRCQVYVKESSDPSGWGVLILVTLWRPAKVGCSVPLLTVVITIACRKPGISSVFRKNNLLLFIKKDERSGGHQAYLN